MSTNPTLILVPGAWHLPAYFSKIIPLLTSKSFTCIPFSLPSTNGTNTVTLLDDITALRTVIIGETSEGRDVVLVVHSYGGAVGASALKGLTVPKGEKREEGKGYVVGMAMLASGFGPSGSSFIEGLGGKPPPLWSADTASGYAVLTSDPPPRESFYHDLPVEEGDYWVSQLTKQSLKVLMEGGEHSYAGWMDLPVWYLVASEDKACPAFVQRMMVKMAQDAGGDITEREVPSSHSPMLSRPTEVVEFIVDAVGTFTK
ncbi:Alpha/beta hydrolase fold-1 [Tricladium varicosporioides]|nr:Alpha/beta hydrolase fold-1 [Hymenoscyphus varicosporioides]